MSLKQDEEKIGISFFWLHENTRYLKLMVGQVKRPSMLSKAQ